MHDTNTQSGTRTIAAGDMATHTTDQHEHTRTVAAQCYLLSPSELSILVPHREEGVCSMLVSEQGGEGEWVDTHIPVLSAKQSQ